MPSGQGEPTEGERGWPSARAGHDRPPGSRPESSGDRANIVSDPLWLFSPPSSSRLTRNHGRDLDLDLEVRGDEAVDDDARPGREVAAEDLLIFLVHGVHLRPVDEVYGCPDHVLERRSAGLQYELDVLERHAGLRPDVVGNPKLLLDVGVAVVKGGGGASGGIDDGVIALDRDGRDEGHVRRRGLGVDDPFFHKTPPEILFVKGGSFFRG